MKFYGNDIANLARRRVRPAFVDDPLFGSVLEALPDAAALMELDGRIKQVNSKFEMLLSLGKGELVGTELVSHAATGGQIIQKAAAALQQLKRLEASGTLPSQRFVVASLGILRTSDGGAYAALLVLREPNRIARAAGSGPDRFRFQDDGGLSMASPYVPAPYLQGLMKSGALALERGSPILVTGESGTGKSEFVRRLCKAGEQGAAPFVHVNCGMLGDAQFEAEMFGIEPGSAADSSTRGKSGYVEAADGGVLFLDQVTDLSPVSQARLVAFLETRTYSRLGSSQRRQVRIGLVAATNAHLRQMVVEGAFRADLYYRLAVVTLELPPLRGQTEFIRVATDSFVRRINMARRPALTLSPEFFRMLQEHDFPGNIRELSNIVEHAAASADDLARVQDFVVPLRTPPPAPTVVQPPPLGSAGLKNLVQEFESWVLEKSIAENGSKRSAAKALGIDIATLIRKTNRKR
ncbi:transcriptional regulator with PAS, ATPase and Fis domain [Mesorhizobium soli]|uniref:sigma 54-interacting transcriptional regulator n=1 Tax=Pseudaminobacter soli (ex Li et al. 2025) TaxID=1295366 RepID=UPI00247479DC|nr:sigma 54-interacting transcriptional regulator [Mesorhizobium soli]MDH6233878.1 transcriptional regulator with PAS, ATPase and Fis domain [Mesorhizobium soli]